MRLDASLRFFSLAVLSFQLEQGWSRWFSQPAKWHALDSGGGNQSKTQKNQEAQSTTFSPMSLGVKLWKVDSTFFQSQNLWMNYG